MACYRIPALVAAANGDLVAAIDERVPSCSDLRANRDINIVVRRSSDGGTTWSPIRTVVDFPPGRSASDPSMIVDAVTGDLFLFYNFMDHDEAPGIYRMHVLQSSDDGATWNTPADITPQITRPAWREDFQFITSGHGIQARSGLLLNTLVNLERGLHLFGSANHGASWFLIDTPIRPGDESRVVELSDGSWMVNSRVSGAGLRYSHVSSDSGRTWRTAAEPTLGDPGVNAGPIRYEPNDGTRSCLVFANAHSPTDGKISRSA